MLCAPSPRRRGPDAAAAGARELLAGAIANTRGSYLVYNFGSGFPAPMLNAAGNWYEMNNGGRLMIIKAASQRLAPRLLVDSHTGYQARCERDPRARTGEGLWQASETLLPAAGMAGAGPADVRDQRQLLRHPRPAGWLMEVDRLQFAAGRLRRQHPRAGPTNAAVTGTVAYAGKQGLSGGDETWTALSTMIMPVAGAPFVVPPKSARRLRRGHAGDPGPAGQGNPVRRGQRDGAAGSRRHRPAQRPRPERGAHRDRLRQGRDEMYVFQGGNYTPDQIQDLFRGLGSDTAVLLDGGGSSAIVLRRDTGGMWAGAGVPRGSCDTIEVLCDSHERACPAGSRSTDPHRRFLDHLRCRRASFRGECARYRRRRRLQIARTEQHHMSQQRIQLM